AQLDAGLTASCPTGRSSDLADAGGSRARLGWAGASSAGRETAGPPARRQAPATATRLPDWNLLLGLEAGCALLRTGEVDSSRRRSEEHTSELQSRFELVCRL